jgi:hypothetical protein
MKNDEKTVAALRTPLRHERDQSRTEMKQTLFKCLEMTRSHVFMIIAPFTIFEATPTR